MHITLDRLDWHVLHCTMDSTTSVNRGQGPRLSSSANLRSSPASSSSASSFSSATVNMHHHHHHPNMTNSSRPYHKTSLPTTTINTNTSTIPQNSAPFESQYRMCKIIGRGGFGSVFAGIRLRDQMPVAIKQLKKTKIRNWDSASLHYSGVRVPLEINLLNRVNAVSGVIKMFDWFDRNDHYLIVMERPSSCSDLFDFITQKGTSVFFFSFFYFFLLRPRLIYVHRCALM